MRWIKTGLHRCPGLLFTCIVALAITGCRGSKPVQREAATPSPPPLKPAVEFKINLGSIDLSAFTRKIEKKDILKFAAQMKRDSIDVLTVQGVTRYPGLSSRIDIVDELSAASGMTFAFGETMTLSGRQNGNSVFSHYPIRSYESTQYPRLRSTRFESALQAIIDCGEREIVVVSTRLPEKTTQDEQAAIISTLGGFSAYYVNRPIVIGGNLLLPELLRSLISYIAVQDDKEKSLPKIWFSNDGSLKITDTKTVETALGKMFRVRLSISSPPHP